MDLAPFNYMKNHEPEAVGEFVQCWHGWTVGLIVQMNGRRAAHGSIMFNFFHSLILLEVLF